MPVKNAEVLVKVAEMRNLVNRVLVVDDPSVLADNYDDLVEVMRLLGRNRIALCVGVSPSDMIALDLAREVGNEEGDEIGRRVAAAVLSYQMGITPAWYLKHYGGGEISSLWTKMGRALVRLAQQTVEGVLSRVPGPSKKEERDVERE